MFHVIQMSWHFDLPLKLPGHIVAMSGWAGVDLFFVLSGFMLMHAHGHQFMELSKPVCSDFALSRFFRVFPLSAAVLLAILILVLIDTNFADWYRNRRSGSLSVEAFFATLALATAWYPRPGEWNGPVWSLSAELIGYLFFPLIAWLFARIRSYSICIFVAASCIFGVIIEQYLLDILGGNNIDPISGNVRMAGYFTAGVVLRRAAQIRPDQRGLSMLSLVSAAAIIALIWLPGGAAFMPVAFAALIYALFNKRGMLSWALSTRLVIFLGIVSFPLYLIHAMALFAYNFHVANGDLPRSYYNVGLVVVLALVLALSWIAHITIERPSHRFARKLIHARRH